MFEFIGFIWFFRTSKIVLFYLYLWQLKEYHVGRFLDHFSTDKGRKLIFNPVNILKIILLLVFPFVPLLTFFGTIAFYLFEFVKTSFDFATKRIKLPILTKKSIFLISASLVLQIAFLFIIFRNLWYFERFIIFWDVGDIVVFTFWILLFDVLTPLIVSIVVFLFQPFAVLMRNRMIKKAKAKREKLPNLLVVGITGSYGKTSTKEFLYTILFSKFNGKVLKTKEHQNSEVGISQCILNNLNENHRIFIVEMGAYNVGGIKLLCDITRPRIGILTGINEQHMATFGSQGNIIKAKYELIESLPKDGIAFFNARNKYCVELYNKTLQRGSGQAFLYGQEAKFFGEENILGAMAVARELGMSEEEIQNAVNEIGNKMPGIKLKKGINRLNVIDATYSANPDGVIANLEYLKTLRQAQGKLIIVMPCLIELGKASKEVHGRIGKKIAEVCDLAIITTKDYFKEIVEGALLRQGYEGREIKKDNILFLENPKEIFEKIKEFTKEGDVVLLESRVPKNLINLLLE